MDRITRKTLELMVERINEVTGMEKKPYGERRADGTLPVNVGNYHLSGAFGGWSLQQIENDDGGASQVFCCGYISARDLNNRMRAFLDGIERGKMKGATDA